MSQRRITVTSCNGCPFAHRERGEPDAFFCAIDRAVPTVTAHVRARDMPETCPVINDDYRVTSRSPPPCTPSPA